MVVVWNYLGENVADITRGMSIIAASVGALAFISVVFFWKMVQRRYREAAAKIAVACFRALAATAGLLTKAHSDDPSNKSWAITLGVAIAGYAFWEIAGAVGDSKHKAAKEKSAEEQADRIEDLEHARDDAVLEASRRTWLLAHAREQVSKKIQRVRGFAKFYEHVRASVPQIREGLAPDEQIRIILESLASLLRIEAVPLGGTAVQNFRIGLFIEREGHLQPIDAFDLATKRHDPFSSPVRHPERFSLDNVVNPSHAVRCVQEGRTIIVPDCRTAAGFEFFEMKQSVYLRSLVAFPLTDCRPDGISPSRAAILIDTDKAGFFREEDRETIENRIQEFVVRIELEYAIRGLTG